MQADVTLNLKPMFILLDVIRRNLDDDKKFEFWANVFYPVVARLLMREINNDLKIWNQAIVECTNDSGLNHSFIRSILDNGDPLKVDTSGPKHIRAEKNSQSYQVKQILKEFDLKKQKEMCGIISNEHTSAIRIPLVSTTQNYPTVMLTDLFNCHFLLCKLADEIPHNTRPIKAPLPEPPTTAIQSFFCVLNNFASKVATFSRPNSSSSTTQLKTAKRNQVVPMDENERDGLGL